MKLTIRFILLFCMFFSGTAARAGAYDDVIRAISMGDHNTVTSLLQKGLDVDSVDREGDTLLMMAAKEGNVNVIRALLSRKPKVGAQNSLGESALMFASIKGHLEVVKLLLAEGAQIDQAGWTPLMYAASMNRIDVMKLLVVRGAKIDAPNSTGVTALMLAAREGQTQAVLLLMEYGANVNQVAPGSGYTALKASRQRNHDEITRILLKAGAKE